MIAEDMQDSPHLTVAMRTDVEQMEDMRTGEVMEDLSEIEEAEVEDMVVVIITQEDLK